MRVLICGGRDFDRLDVMDRVLDTIHKKTPITHIIWGGAKGADEMGGDWAYVNNIPSSRYPALWHKHGKSAGAIRNQQMIDEGKPDLVVAFPTKKSIGTYDMIRRAEKHDIKLIIVKEEVDE